MEPETQKPPLITGNLTLSGDRERFLAWIEAQGFDPGVVETDRYSTTRHDGGGLLVRSLNPATASRSALELIELSPGPTEGDGFRLDYRVWAPKWWRFCRTICLCATLVPVVVLWGLAALVATVFPSYRDMAEASIYSPLFLVPAVPIVLVGLFLPFRLRARQIPLATERLQAALHAAAGAARQDGDKGEG